MQNKSFHCDIFAKYFHRNDVFVTFLFLVRVLCRLRIHSRSRPSVKTCVAVCCSVLQCVALCCSVLALRVEYNEPEVNVRGWEPSTAASIVTCVCQKMCNVMIHIERKTQTERDKERERERMREREKETSTAKCIDTCVFPENAQSYTDIHTYIHMSICVHRKRERERERAVHCCMNRQLCIL